MTGTLYLVSIPIGNEDDITYRALRILKEVDIIVCEEKKTGRKFISSHSLNYKHQEILNEHNEGEVSGIIIDFLKGGKNVALISDAGTPVFSDPGKILVELALKNFIKIVPVPGVSSIVPALILSGFFINEFVFCGFLSPKSDERKMELEQMRSESRTMVIMDTPYRLKALMRDIADVFRRERRVAVAFNLTMKDEQVFRGWPDMLYDRFTMMNLKGEFVVIIEGRKVNKDNTVEL